MDLITSLQNIATPFITLLAVIFDFCGSFSFFLIIFSFFFFFINKEFAYKYFIAFTTSFSLNSLLKNIICRERPYNVNPELRADRSSYSYSLPSFTANFSGINTVAFLNRFYNKNKSSLFKIMFLFILILFVILVCLSQLYLAENYLLDVIIGIVLGVLIAHFIFKYLKISAKFIKIFSIVLPIILLGLFFCLFGSVIRNDFSNLILFEFTGLGVSLSVGYFVEEKFIKYEIKNNFFACLIKALIVTIFLIAFILFDNFFTGHVIYGLIKYLIVGFFITILLPLFFKKIEKYFYTFSLNVKNEKIVFSSISFSLKQTKKIALKIFKNLKQGDCVLLSGDLGAGKSVIVREVLRIAGITSNVTSPTFTLVNEYKTEYYHFYHFDMYRLEDEEEVINIGFDEILDDKFAIKFIEWPEKIDNVLRKNQFKKITVVKLGKRTRNIIFENYN